MNGIIAYESDLLVLSADRNMVSAVEGLVQRSKALNIRPIKSSFYHHPERDPGCLLRADAFLRPFVNRYAHAIVIFDRAGCGQDEKTRDELEEMVTAGLSRSGWGNRADAIVIDPELENWVFSDSPEVDAAVGWADKISLLRPWLKSNGYWLSNQAKPCRPKEAMEAALRHARMPRSSSIYARLAEKVGLSRCTDPAFLKLKSVLRVWFPEIDTKL